MRQKYRKCPRLSQVGKMPKLSVHNAHQISNTALEGYMKPSVLHFINIQLHLHLADAFIQSDSDYTFLSVCVFPGNWTHNLLRC